jgi:hypothetical protein
VELNSMWALSDRHQLCGVSSGNGGHMGGTLP